MWILYLDTKLEGICVHYRESISRSKTRLPKMQEAADELIGLDVHGYRITRKVGSGGMGAVYEANHATIGQRVAIKVLFPEFSQSEDDVRRFVDEARAAGKVEHPGLVRIYNHGRLSTNIAFIMMEFLSGESLRKYLERVLAEGRAIALVEALSIAHEIAEALVSVHRLDIVHRDIKPENLILCQQEQSHRFNRVKIVDFGIAKFNNMNSSGGVKSTTVGRFLGTALYASPEQCQMAGAVTTKADVYSLGVVLYEMIAGRPPFLAEQPGMVIGMHLFQHPPPLEKFVAGVPESVEQLITDMLVKEPKQRLSMEQVLKRIIAIETGVSSGKISRRRRRQLTSAMISVFFALMLSGLYFYIHKTTNRSYLPSTPTYGESLPSQAPKQADEIPSTDKTTVPPPKPQLQKSTNQPLANTGSAISKNSNQINSKKKLVQEHPVAKKLVTNTQASKNDTTKASAETNQTDTNSKLTDSSKETKEAAPALSPAATKTKAKRTDHEDAFY